MEALIRQVSAPVRWEDVVRRLVADGVTTFIEVGPGRALSGMVKRISRRSQITSVGDLESIMSLGRN